MTHHRNILKSSITILLLALGATGVRFLFNPAIGSRAPLLVYTLAVAVAAQIAGTVPGLIVTAISVILVERSTPASDVYMPTVLLIFAVVGAALSAFGGWRKRAEDQRRRIQFNLETAQQIANIGSWQSEGDGRLWWSPQTYKIFGVETGTELSSNDFYELVHAEDRARVREAVAQAIRTRSDYEIEHRIVRRSDGEVRYVHQQAKLVSNGSTHLVGSIRDITDTRRGEMAQQILGELLHVCASCRRIRDANTEQWYSMEAYLRRHAAAKFTHGMCEDCGRHWFPEAVDHEPIARR